MFYINQSSAKKLYNIWRLILNLGIEMISFACIGRYGFATGKNRLTSVSAKLC